MGDIMKSESTEIEEISRIKFDDNIEYIVKFNGTYYYSSYELAVKGLKEIKRIYYKHQSIPFNGELNPEHADTSIPACYEL